ncbi:Fungal N-terminal domain of STAND protein [Pleurostoma richardsiae]|uniref:Fungal N-terminal domain of STAND protein n=1 Tax=Pleurostoma richardsiae TaxID=41990 RepID=A0AA38VNL3_9PEZI|nr:Fungal N-terminal domain of STAND protein [Pleurostoma richardsiae]
MADPISVTSGLVTLVAFTLQSTQSLYQVIESFRSHQRTVRELREELGALTGVLQSLQEMTASQNSNLAALKVPLLRCGQACKDFEVLISKYTTHSDGSKTSLRDWAKLRYMGDDIVGFKNMLAGYKATIAIAIGDANMRTAVVTASVLAEYKELISNTKSDLEEHLREIDSKLQKLSAQTDTAKEVPETKRIREERESAQRCLEICVSVSAHIDQVQSASLPNSSSSAETHEQAPFSVAGASSARNATVSALKDCKDTLAGAATHLQTHLEGLNASLGDALSQGAQEGEDHDRIREEVESIKQCLNICAHASEAVQHRTNVVEDVLAEDDAHQVAVATLGDLISVKSVKAGARSAQWLGQMSDASLQQLSKDFIRVASVEPHTKMGTKFERRYGTGHTLGPNGLDNGDTTQ